MKISRLQFQTILDNAPEGVDKGQLAEKFIQDGHDIEGIDSNKIKQTLLEKEALLKKPEIQPEQGGNPLTEAISGGVGSLKTLYGGGEEGIANKLGKNITEGADAFEKGTQMTDENGIITAKGVYEASKGGLKTGLRTMGDVASTVYAPVGAALSTATGGYLGKAFDKVGEFAQGKGGIIDKITDNESVQKFVMNRPNLGEDFGRAMSIVFAAKDGGKIDPKTAIPRTIEQIKGAGNTLMAPVRAIKGEVNNLKQEVGKSDLMTKSIDELRSEKVTSGYNEQNSRLKSVNNAYKKNIKTYKEADGTVKKVTPVDTLSKHNIVPEVDKGTINMGDYQNGVGALGKIKGLVEEINGNIESKLASSKGSTEIRTLKEATIKEIKSNTQLKASGQVQSNINKLNSIFKDFEQSYGKNLSDRDVNSIRIAMNKIFNPETVDASRAVGNAARKVVYNITPDQSVKALLRQEGELFSARNYAEALNGTKVTGGRLGNYAMRTGGALIGAGVKGVPLVGPLAGMLGGEYLARVLQQTQFKSPLVEAKAFLQRSNKAQPIKSAKATPNKANIDKSIPQNPKLAKFEAKLKADNVKLAKEMDVKNILDMAEKLKGTEKMPGELSLSPEQLAKAHYDLNFPSSQNPGGFLMQRTALKNVPEEIANGIIKEVPKYKTASAFADKFGKTFGENFSKADLLEIWKVVTKFNKPNNVQKAISKMMKGEQYKKTFEDWDIPTTD